MPIDPRFRPLVECLVNKLYPGDMFGILEVTDEQSSCLVTSVDQDMCEDHFKLLIPYAGYMLVWEVRFDSSQPRLAPDFVFDDESFAFYLDNDSITEGVPSLLHWNVDDPYCLCEVVQQLLRLYSTHQLIVLRKDGSSYLSDEYVKLVKDVGLEETQIQVLVGGTQLIPQFNRSSRPPRNTVSITLMQLEQQAGSETIFEEYFSMALQFSLAEYSDDTVTLHIHPTLRASLEMKGDLAIPQYCKVQGLAHYVKNVISIIQETLSKVCKDIEKREEFHVGLLYEIQELVRSNENISLTTLDFDPIQRSKSSYMLGIDQVKVLLEIETPLRSNIPKIILRSIISGNITDVPVDSSMPWEPSKILTTVLQKYSNSII